MIEITVGTWIESLTFNRVWDEERDTPRIRYAFKVLCTSCDHWPAPKNLIEHLPSVHELTALPAKVVSDEVAQENIAKIKAMLAESLCPVPPEDDVKDECPPAYGNRD
jgi:hypothetical protein